MKGGRGSCRSFSHTFTAAEEGRRGGARTFAAAPDPAPAASRQHTDPPPPPSQRGTSGATPLCCRRGGAATQRLRPRCCNCGNAEAVFASTAVVVDATAPPLVRPSRRRWRQRVELRWRASDCGSARRRGRRSTVERRTVASLSQPGGEGGAVGNNAEYYEGRPLPRRSRSSPSPRRKGPATSE